MIRITESFLEEPDIREADEPIRCYCNGGFQDTLEAGTLAGVGDVYYNRTSLAKLYHTHSYGRNIGLLVIRG